MKRLCILWLYALSLLLYPNCASTQVVQIAAGATTLSNSSGAEIGVFGPGSRTRFAVGVSDGLHLGYSREVELQNSRFTIGDVAPPLSLLSDGPQHRHLYARGALAQVHDATRDVTMFVGMSGEQRGSALFSTLTAQKPVFVLKAVSHRDGTDLEALVLRGTTNAMLTSVSRKIGTYTNVAFTLGRIGHTNVTRALLHTAGQSWSLDASETSAPIRLLSDVPLQSDAAEEVGLNFSAKKIVGQSLSFDLGRHEYASTVSQNTASTGERSVLWESGMSARRKSLGIGLRALLSSQAGRRDGGLAWIASWQRARWDVRATLLERRSRDASVSGTTTLQVDNGQRAGPHVRFEEGVQFGSGNPRIDAGGVVEGNRGSLRVSHSETYVASGTSTGFKRMLTVALQLHLRNATLQMGRSSASGIRSEYNGSVVDFEGNDFGAAAVENPASRQILRYAIEGTVRQDDDGTPVAGAAVAAGSQVVYTDSEGHWLARFSTKAQVRVTLLPKSFLTQEKWDAKSVAMSVSPGTQRLDLRVRRAELNHDAAHTELPKEDEDSPESGTKRSVFRTIGSLLRKLLLSGADEHVENMLLRALVSTTAQARPTAMWTQ